MPTACPDCGGSVEVTHVADAGGPVVTVDVVAEGGDPRTGPLGGRQQGEGLRRGREIEMALAGGAHDAGEHLLGVGAVAAPAPTMQELSEHGLASVRGRLVARLGRLIDAPPPLDDAERFARHLATEFAAVVNGHSKFPHLRSPKIPPPLVYKAMR